MLINVAYCRLYYANLKQAAVCLFKLYIGSVEISVGWRSQGVLAHYPSGNHSWQTVLATSQKKSSDQQPQGSSLKEAAASTTEPAAISS